MNRGRFVGQMGGRAPASCSNKMPLPYSVDGALQGKLAVSDRQTGGK